MSKTIHDDPDDSDDMQLVRQAILFENVDLLTDLLNEHPQAAFKIDRHGRTPLMLAAHNGKCSSLLTILSLFNETKDLVTKQGKSALHLAAEAGEVNCAKLLISFGADRDKCDELGHCPLESAHITGHSDVANAIIEIIEEEHLRLQELHQKFIKCCSDGDLDNIEKILNNCSYKDHYTLFNGSSPNHNTALFISCTNGQVNVVKKLLQYDKHLLIHSKTEDTIIHAAISSQNCEIIELMLKRFPELVEKVNLENSTCLHWAVRSGNVDVVALLLNFEYDSSHVKEIDNLTSSSYFFAFDVNQVDNECRTALCIAVANGHMEIVKFLLEFKCASSDSELRCPFQVDVYCNKGTTPLMIAAYNQFFPILSYLIENGADINLPLAVLDSDEDCVEGRCIGSGALVEATRSDAVHIVHYLLDRGAVDTDNKALSLASTKNNDKLVRVFLTRLVFPDSEYKVNKRNIDIGQLQVGQSLLPSALCPSKAAMLNWSSAGLQSIQADWLIASAFQINPRLRTTRLALAAITRVDLSKNRLSVVPTVLFQMPSLRSLNLSSNSISVIDVPPFYVSSTSLEILILKENFLKSLPTQFLSSFPSLITLDLSSNQLVSLPEFIWLSPSLKELNVSRNQLCSLPIVPPRGRGSRNVPNLIQSTENNIISDGLELPENVKIKSLSRVNIWQASLSLSKINEEDMFPDFPVTSSSTLLTLNLSHNKFQVFPSCLACTCPRLSSLNLSHNSMSCLPPICCIPLHLRTLDVSFNNLTGLFQNISTLYSVCYALPPSDSSSSTSRRHSPPQRHNRSRSKSAVRSQRSLSVSRHQKLDGDVEELCVHKQHISLQWLKTLTLSGNHLTSFEVVFNDKVLFPVLSVLDLSSNDLKSVSAHLAKLSSLSVLNLSQNIGVRELPPQIGMLSKLWSLSLKGCNLKEPLHSMVNVDNCKTVEIVAFLKTILEESKCFRHIKLMILGEERVGKSLLWEGLKSEGVQKKSVIQTDSVRIADWKHESKKNKKDNLGVISISAWDFVGHRDYHAAHPYFLNRRSIFLVVWRIPDGENALQDVQRWLISIQARTPNSCVILVGTHADQVLAHPSRFTPTYLKDMENVVRSRFMVADADKRGLPRVMDLLFISAKSKQDVKALLHAIYVSSWEVRVGKERALSQQIPSSYIALLKVVKEWSEENRKENLSSALTLDVFHERAKTTMTSKFGSFFRDDIEFSAALTFLHDCGSIVHFEDAALRQIVFIDPIWLSDFFAHLMALRSSSLPAGLLLQDALTPLAKRLRQEVRSCLLDLLHKYEMALLCQPRKLLIPALLPDEYRLRSDFPGSAVKLPINLKNWNLREAQKDRHNRLKAMSSVDKCSSNVPSSDLVFMFNYKENELRRLYVMAYIPSGFWSRLITRIVGDHNVANALESLFVSEGNSNTDFLKANVADHLKLEWMVWQTGIELLLKGHSIAVIKHFCPLAEVREVDYLSANVETRDDQKRWRQLILTNWALIEIVFPSLSVTCSSNCQSSTMTCDVEGRSRLMAILIDLVDTLLEDWYPSLGTRFVHSSEGELLVNRLVPCSQCVRDLAQITKRCHDDSEIMSVKKEEISMRCSKTTGNIHSLSSIKCFSIEECMLAAREYGWLECPSHGGIHVKDMAPDAFFVDIESSLKISNERIRRGRMLGRGAFGFVFRASLKSNTGEMVEVAQKMLEPVDPGPSGRSSAITAYKAAADKWRRDALEFSCRAYCTSRQELNLLSRMKHSNVISLIGVCVSPLSLIVELAPLGALNQLLSSHRKSGSRLSLAVIRETAMQVAKALEYLHSNHIIYRDLKSENVLGWRFPSPFSPQTDVLVKLGDYGISRSILPSGGAKGFGGTEGFIAPEIVRYNGEEEYTQKVDVFSFGMFLYELITLKQPFEEEEHVKERLLEGARPQLLPHELLVPCTMLDLLVLCWQTNPDSRPSSSQLVGYCSAPEFCHILDICQLNDVHPSGLLSVCLNDDLDDPDDFEAQLYIAGSPVNVLSCTQYAWIDQKELSNQDCRFVSRIRDVIWCCDDSGNVALYSLSLHSLGNLRLPSLGSALIKAPELVCNNLLLLVAQHEIVLLTLSDNNSVSLKGTMQSPEAITTAIFVSNSNYRQIWTGHAEGRISIHNLTSDDTFSFSSSIYMKETDLTVKDMITNNDGSYAWITFAKSSRIYCVDVERRQVHASLDVKKVMPASETIYTIDMNVVSDTEVTCICLLESMEGSQLYIGTSKGLLIITQAILMQPISACRPYEGQLSMITTLERPREDENCSKQRGSLSTTSSESSLSWVREKVTETMERLKLNTTISSYDSHALVATIGRGFRSLAHRFVAEAAIEDSLSIAIWKTEDWV